MIYYKNLRKLFEGTGLTYRQLSHEMRIHWITLNRMANSTDSEAYNVSLRLIDKICAYFNVPLSDILEFSSSKKTNKKRPRTKAIK